MLQITLSGFSFVVINFLTLLWYNPSLDQDMPPWVYASWSVGLFLYQTFDAVDGTQAYVEMLGDRAPRDLLIFGILGGEHIKVDLWGSCSITASLMEDLKGWSGLMLRGRCGRMQHGARSTFVCGRYEPGPELVYRFDPIWL